MLNVSGKFCGALPARWQVVGINGNGVIKYFFWCVKLKTAPAPCRGLLNVSGFGYLCLFVTGRVLPGNFAGRSGSVFSFLAFAGHFLGGSSLVQLALWLFGIGRVGTVHGNNEAGNILHLRGCQLLLPRDHAFFGHTIFNGFKYSSLIISPGWIGRILFIIGSS